LRLDAIEYAWNRRVVSYGEDRQLQLFEQWFGTATRNKVLVVLAVATSLALIFVAFLSIRKIPAKRGRSVDRLYREYCNQLAKIGLPREQGEGPQDYLRRVAQTRPDLADSLEQVTRLYMAIAYQSADQGTQNASPEQTEMRQAIRELRVRLANSTT